MSAESDAEMNDNESDPALAWRILAKAILNGLDAVNERIPWSLDVETAMVRCLLEKAGLMFLARSSANRDLTTARLEAACFAEAGLKILDRIAHGELT